MARHTKSSCHPNNKQRRHRGLLASCHHARELKTKPGISLARHLYKLRRSASPRHADGRVPITAGLASPLWQWNQLGSSRKHQAAADEWLVEVINEAGVRVKPGSMMGDKGPAHRRPVRSGKPSSSSRHCWRAMPRARRLPWATAVLLSMTRC